MSFLFKQAWIGSYEPRPHLFTNWWCLSAKMIYVTTDLLCQDAIRPENRDQYWLEYQKKPSIHFIKIDGWHLTDNGLWWKLANAMLTSIFYCKHNEICCLTRQEFKTRKICMWFQMIYFTIYIWKINTPWKYMKVKS